MPLIFPWKVYHFSTFLVVVVLIVQSVNLSITWEIWENIFSLLIDFQINWRKIFSKYMKFKKAIIISSLYHFNKLTIFVWPIDISFIKFILSVSFTNTIGYGYESILLNHLHEGFQWSISVHPETCISKKNFFLQSVYFLQSVVSIIFQRLEIAWIRILCRIIFGSTRT